MAQSPEAMAAAMVANMPEKTGKSLPQWLKIAKASKLAKHGEITKFLKAEHGLTHGYASLIAHRALGNTFDGGDELVDAQYAGAKADLRPIYDAILKEVRKFGNDVEVSPKKANVSLRRSKQFALVQPSTRTRVDVGLKLKGEPTTERLEASGSFSDMVSHRVRVTSVDEVDAELVGWLREAYQRA